MQEIEDKTTSQTRGLPVTKADRFWLELAQKMIQESPKHFDSAAKEMVKITTLAQVIYFSVISISDLREILGKLITKQQWFYAIFFILPVLAWLVSLFFSIRVFSPRPYQFNLKSPDLARDACYDLMEYKQNNLRAAHLALFVGLGFLVLDSIIYLAYFYLSSP